MIRKVRFNRALSVFAAVCLLASCLLVGNVFFLAGAESYAGGAGTESDPYRIATAEQLAAIKTGTESAGVYYQLTANVTVTNVSLGQNNGKPEAFEGVFDGAGYTVTYNYDSSVAYGGLFSALKGATVKNLTVEGTVSQTGFTFGTIAGVAYGGSLIENCVSRVNITGARQWVGGIVGAMGGATLRMVENAGSISTNTQRVDPLGNIAAPSTFNLGVGMAYEKNNTAVAGIVAVTSGSNTLENVLNTGNVTNNLAEGNVTTAGVVGMDWNQNNAARIGNLKLIAVGNTGSIIETRTRPSDGTPDNDRTGGVYGNLENTTVTLDRVWSSSVVTAAVKTDGKANRFTGAVGGGDGGAMTVVNPSVYYVPGKLTNTSFSSAVYTEAVGKSNATGTFNGHIFADGKDVDMKSAAFAELLGDGWMAVEGSTPVLTHKSTTLPDYAGGTGTETDPYQINTPEQMERLNADTLAGTTAGKFYQLTSNITVNRLSIGQNKGYPVAFEGTFDGAEHTVTYNYASSTAYGGLFSALKGATVKNLTVEGTVTQTGFVFGTIAGVAYGGSLIENCISRVNITDARQWVGGIVGAMGGATLRLTENNGSISTNTQRVDPLGSIAAPSTFNLGVGMAYEKNNTAVAGIVAITSGSNTLENVLNTGNVTNNLAEGNVTTAGVVGMDWNQNNAARIGNLKLIAVGNTGSIIETRTRPSNGTPDNDRTGGVYGNLENTTVTLDRVWSSGVVTAAVKTDGKANRFTGAVGGGDGGSMTVVNPSVYYVPGKLTNTSFSSAVYTEAVGKSNAAGTFNGHIFADGKDVDLKSAAFATLLGGGWTTTAGGYPTLLHTKMALEPYAGGSGTALDPYQIATVGQLERLNAEVLAGKADGVHYRLTADLTVDGLSIGQNMGDPVPFTGVFDGYYHTIHYTYGSTTPYGGLFSVLKGATVKNLTIDGTVTETGFGFGSIAAAAYNGSLVENCVSRVNISGAKEWVGGVIGMMGGATLRRVQNDGSVSTDTKRVGSLSGTHDVKEYGIKVYDPNNTAVAGIVAVTSGNNVLEDVLNTGNITNNLADGNVETAGVLGLDVSNAGNTLKLIAVGNTGTIKATRERPASGAPNDDRTGGVYGQLELSTVTLDRIWSTGTVTAAVTAAGQANSRTGAVGGGSGGAAVTIDSPTMYYIPGTLTNQNFSGTRKNEAVGVANGYKGTQLFESKLDLKSAEFVAILGENWQQTDNGYPTLRVRQAALRNLLLTNAVTGKAIALTPEFNGAVTEYTLKVAYSVEKVAIQADPAYANATVTGAVGETTLQVGQNELTVTVQGADGSTMSYVVRIKRTNENPSSDATLKSLSLSGVTLNESFSASRTEYTATVPWQVESVTLAAEVNNAWAELAGTGEKTLEVGENPLYVTVTAEDDSQQTYTVRVTREALFRQGTGTEADPYRIETEQDLRNFATATNRMAGTTWAGTYFRLIADIDLRGELWTPIATSNNNAFGGVFDGAGHTVKNLKIDVDNETAAQLDTQRSVDGLGLFGSINGGKGYTAIIRNVQVEGSIVNRMTSVTKVGGIVGQVPTSTGADAAPLIENCTFRGSLASNKEGIGGILGEASNSSVRIINCTNYGSVSVPTEGYKPQRTELLRCAAGIVGAVYSNDLETVLQGCTNYGDVTGTYMIGGIIGRLSQCVGLNKDGKGYNLGILAENGYQAKVTYCANYGAVTKGDYDVDAQGAIGGLVGITTDGAAEIRHDGAILFDHLYNVGTVTAKNYFDIYLGGVIGAHNLLGELRSCYNLGRLVVSEERDLTGAIAGAVSERDGGKQALIENCYYWGASNLEGIPIGLAGDTEGVVEAKTRTQFGSGEVAFLLDGGNTDGRTYTWTQDTVKEFPVFGTGEETAVFAEGDHYTIGRNGTVIRATINDSNEPNSGDDDVDDTYPVDINTDILNAFLDVDEKVITLFSDDVAIWEVNDALILNNVTVRYFDWFGREIHNDEVVLQTDMMMKVYRADGSLLDTFTFCIDGEEISDPSDRVATGVPSYVPIALIVLAGAALTVVLLGRKKRA